MSTRFLVTFMLVIVSASMHAQLPVAQSTQDAAPGAEPIASFKSSVELVPISAVVRDGRGRLVTNLKAADFQVFEEREPRRIVTFEASVDSAVALAFLVDVSGSMRMGPKLAYARRVIAPLAAGLSQGRDEAALFTFDRHLDEQQAFTNHPSSVIGSFEHVAPYGQTSLYDAVAETAKRVSERPALRRAVVVFTDGLDTSSELSPADVSGLASSIDVPVYVVVTVPEVDTFEVESATPRLSGDLRDLSWWTGGDVLTVTRNDRATPVALQILNELRHQYLLAIESVATAEWRPIDVRARNKSHRVRARSGYFGGQ